MTARRGWMITMVITVLTLSGLEAGTNTPSLDQAIKFVEQGNYPEALDQLAALPVSSLSIQERNRARYLHGHVALRLKRYAEAMQAFVEVVSQYPELGDYATWNVARIHQELNAERPYVDALRLLLRKFPHSRLVPQARLALGRQLMRSNSQPGEGVGILEEFVNQAGNDPLLPEAYLWLGQGYEASGLPDKALATYRTLYIRFPVSPEAEQAAFRVQTMAPPGRTLAADLSPREHLERADRLAEAGECEQAIHVVRQLPSSLLPEDLTTWSARRLGFCAYRLRRYREAISSLDQFRAAQGSDEPAAEALYLLGLALQRDGRVAEADGVLRQLVARQPATGWNGKALVALGLSYESRQQTERAIAAYRELATRFPTTDRADELSWRIGWLYYGQRVFGTAAQEFGKTAERFPHSLFASNAVYWQAKALDKNGHSPQSLKLYEQVAREYPYTFYGQRGQEVLRARAGGGATPSPVVVSGSGFIRPGDRSSAFDADASLSEAARFHRVRADELLALRFVEDAREEITQVAQQLGPGISEQTLLARLYFKADLPLQAIRTLNAALSSVPASARLSLPPEFWNALFPQLYWPEVLEATKFSQLDPWLVLGVIRQESAFNARAVSRSNARGLMQLLPSTGREVYQRLGLEAFREDFLFDPHLNVRLGAQYLGQLTNTHRGQLVPALAAYNAGPGRVRQWLKELSTADWDEFIERLPFEETRLYVKSVLRNYGVYQRLYGLAPDGQATR